MKKELLVLTITFLVFGMLMNFPLISADDNNAGKGPNNSIGNNSDNDSEEQICCHIFGYGSNMKKTNSQYEMMDEDECVVPENFVGGGREVVSKKRCELGYTAKIQTAIQAKNKLKLNASEIPENCTKTGSVIRCNLHNGKAMVVMAGNSGNTIIKIDGENISTKAQLYHHNG